MAYINVAEWSPDQVTDWLKGLDNSMYKYVNSFANNEIKGQALLNIRPYELVELGMTSIGHQEIVLEAVEQLRSFNYDLEKENLQFLALHVATTANNLHQRLAYYFDKSKIETQILNDITRSIAMIKPLVGWLDRSPFQGQLQFNEIRKRILRLGIEMATSAQRDRFVENPVDQIRLTAEKLSKLADYIIQDISDPMILQPATLNLVTLKKRESELGFNIVPNYHGVHVVTDIKYNSPAHISGKIEDGDEIIQINYQTVVGWHYKRVLQQLQESPPDVLLTLKKRPRHTKIYGQIYMKPYRLPSKKRSIGRLGENLPSPRIELIPSQNFPMLMPLPEKTTNLSDSDSSSSESILITATGEPAIAQNTKQNDKDLRLYLPKPRAVLQRRNTICGDQASGFRGNIIFWHEINNKTMDQESPSLRDKSVSFGFGLEMTSSSSSSTMRPTTCIGIHNVGTSYDKYGELANALKGSLPDMNSTKNTSKQTPSAPANDVNGNKIAHCSRDSANSATFDDAGTNRQHRSKAVKFSTTNDVIERTSLIEIESIPYADADDVEEEINKRPQIIPAVDIITDKSNLNEPSTTTSMPIKDKPITSDTGLAEAINVALIQSQHEHLREISTKIGCSDDKPPEIGPRREFLKKIAPKPPPRPSKAAELLQRKFDSLKQERTLIQTHSTPVFESKMEANVIAMKGVPFNESKANKVTSNTNSIASASSPLLQRKQNEKNVEKQSPPSTTSQKTVPPAATKHFLDQQFDSLEPLTPNKTKTLTLKKKNFILAKRRKICLKTLEISDIQGHLYRRTKDKHGVSYWAKLYFVLVETALYGFRNKKSTKANCLIFLSGFTVSLAKEVHSKPFAYKVYHPKKTFYFAAESEQALGQWMDYIKRATLKGSTATMDPMLIDSIDARALFSETDSSDNDDENDDAEETVKEGNTHLSAFKSYSFMSGSSKSNSSKKRGSIDETQSATMTTSTNNVVATPKSEKYHLGFGSLKKFTKHSLPFSSSSSSSSNKNEKDRSSEERKKTQSDIPVPTAQFRSYRKIPGNAGMQLGSSSMIPIDYSNMMTPPSRSSTLNTLIESTTTSVLSTTFELPSKPSDNSIKVPKCEVIQHTSSIQCTHKMPSSSPDSSPNATLVAKTFEQHSCLSRPISKLAKMKTLPFNYMHASNPNLVEFTFQTSKTLDYSLPKVNASNSFDAHQNLQGFITLKDLMLQREEDEAHNMYNNRVNLGVEKQNDRQTKRKHRRPTNDEIVATTQNDENRSNDDESANGTHNGHSKVGVNKIQCRSLPKTPDYAQSFKADDTEIIMARSKEGQKLRDFGYEFISGDDANNTNNNTTNVMLNVKPAVLPKPNERVLLTSKRKGLNWMNLSGDNKRNEDEKLMGKGTFKLIKHKVVEPMDLKSLKNDRSVAATPLQRPNLRDLMLHNTIQNDNVPEAHASSSSSTSATFQALSSNNRNIGTNESLNGLNGERRLSTTSTTSYLSKLTFPTTKTAKEKRLLGSPRLHRAIFGRKNAEHPVIDHESFSPMETTTNRLPSREYLQSLNTNNVNSSSSSISMNDAKLNASVNSNLIVESVTNTTPGVVYNSVPSSCSSLSSTSNSTAAMTTTMDKNIEYPPVFEPETYSLCDPATSLTLMRRRTFNRNK